MPSVFFAECPGQVDRYAYIQTFPGLTLADAGYAANLERGVYLSDETKLASLGFDESDYKSLVYAPMSDFRNAAYAFWANYVEGTFLDNGSALLYWEGVEGFSGEEDLPEDVWGVWGWVIFEEVPDEVTEFASSFYSYSPGSDLVESEISEVFEAPSTPEPTLANTGASVEWSLFVGLVGLFTGAGLLAISRRKRSA